MESAMLTALIAQALQEDIGHGDITTGSLVADHQKAGGVFLVRKPGVVAGLDLCMRVFRHLDPESCFTPIKSDGDQVEPDEVLAQVRGRATALLTGERVALNFLQHLSGIATKTRKMAELIAPYRASLIDTRKTTPGLRMLEKYAVVIGGGKNHRFGLYDGIMIKDNHIMVAGGIRQAVELVRARAPHTLKIEVEVENLVQLQEALEAGAEIILLDNMEAEIMRQAVEICNGRALLEASGGINEDTIVEVARTGVDLISCGALTHSAPNLDISFEITE